MSFFLKGRSINFINSSTNLSKEATSPKMVLEDLWRI